MNRATPARYRLTEDSDSVVDGRVEAITILTATRKGLRALTQRIGFWIARRPRWQAENLARSRPQAVQLKRLNFIHTARWVHVNTFPKSRPGSRLCSNREPYQPYRWTMFLSNLNQGWEPYFQAFLDSFGSGIHTIWGESLDYPGYPRPMTRNLLHEWMEHRLPPTQVFYAAYPHLSTNDVRSCLRVDRELESARRDFEAIRDSGRIPHVSDEQLVDAEAARLAERLQHCLIDLAPAPAGWPHSDADGSAGATGLTGFVSLLPIRRGAEAEMAELLCGLADLPALEKTFRSVPGTHFARLTVIDRDQAVKHPNRAIRLQNSWLMFSADFDARVDESDLHVLKRPAGRLILPWRRRAQARWAGELRRYFEAVLRVGALRQIFELCYGEGVSPAADEMRDDLVNSVLDRRIYFRDYPDVTLRDIGRAAKATSKLTQADDLVTAIRTKLLDDDRGTR